MQLLWSAPIRVRNFISNIQPHISGISLDILGHVNYKISATDFKKKQMLIICGGTIIFWTVMEV